MAAPFSRVSLMERHGQEWRRCSSSPLLLQGLPCDVLAHLVQAHLSGDDKWRVLQALFPRAVLVTQRRHGSSVEYALGDQLSTALEYTSCKSARLKLLVRGVAYDWETLDAAAYDRVHPKTLGCVFCGIRALARTDFKRRQDHLRRQSWALLGGFATPDEWHGRFVECLYL